jgi:hypothetical protein
VKKEMIHHGVDAATRAANATHRLSTAIAGSSVSILHLFGTMATAIYLSDQGFAHITPGPRTTLIMALTLVVYLVLDGPYLMTTWTGHFETSDAEPYAIQVAIDSHKNTVSEFQESGTARTNERSRS